MVRVVHRLKAEDGAGKTARHLGPWGVLVASDHAEADAGHGAVWTLPDTAATRTSPARQGGEAYGAPGANRG